MKFRWATDAYRELNGIFCIYKPTDLPIFRVIEKIKGNLARDLNVLPCYRYEGYSKQTSVNTEPSTTSLISTEHPVNITETADLSEHRLVLGQRFTPADIYIKALSSLPKHTSGVQLFGIGPGIQLLKPIFNAMYLRVYHVRGRFGWATDNFSPRGKIIERTSFYHITKPKLDKMCSKTQANHTKHMFKYAGIDEDSQEAYELAAKGLVRPASNDTPPMLYGVRCIEFNLPDFTLEIHAINETSIYFNNLIHDIGLQLKSTAVCTQVRRLRYGHFTLDHALLDKHWTLGHILDNFEMCHKELHPEKLLVGANIAENQRQLEIEDDNNNDLKTKYSLADR